jgi:hypothetical protein
VCVDPPLRQTPAKGSMAGGSAPVFYLQATTKPHNLAKTGYRTGAKVRLYLIHDHKEMHNAYHY